MNTDAIARFVARKQRKLLATDYIDGIRTGQRSLLSQAITLIESTLPTHRALAQEVLAGCLPLVRPSVRIGITGVPGVGKSTFIEALGMHLVQQGHRLAVLAIDPSSERTKGSILGDKTRMEQLAAHPGAFIRPSPSAGSLGGVAHKTRETMLLCEAAGFDVVFIETVGVGQSETVVHSMVDFFLLLMLAGAGDELQGIKRGIMEMADGIAITKADHGNLARATLAQAEYRNALHLFPPTPSGWLPEVHTCSALEQQGIDAVWEMIRRHQTHLQQTNHWQAKRHDQARWWMRQAIEESLRSHFFENPTIRQRLPEIEQAVVLGHLAPQEAARLLLHEYFGESPATETKDHPEDDLIQ